jgi:ATP-dependent Lon protease
MNVLNDLLMRQYLLKEELKEINKEIKEIQEQDSKQLQLDYKLQPRKDAA